MGQTILHFPRYAPSQRDGKVRGRGFSYCAGGGAKCCGFDSGSGVGTLLFLYKEVLNIELPWLNEVTRAKRPAKLPTVLTREEVRGLIQHVDDSSFELDRPVALWHRDAFAGMVAVAGEGCGVFTSRDCGSGWERGKDRVTMLPASLADRLQSHLGVVKAQHVADLALGKGEVW